MAEGLLWGVLAVVVWLLADMTLRRWWWIWPLFLVAAMVKATLILTGGGSYYDSTLIAGYLAALAADCWREVRHA